MLYPITAGAERSAPTFVVCTIQELRNVIQPTVHLSYDFCHVVATVHKDEEVEFEAY